MENLPRELLIEILIRVPVKSLIRFLLVSKSWLALIKSPNFISTHLTRIQRLPTKSCNLLLCRHYSVIDRKEHYSLRPDNDDFVLKSSKIRFPFESPVGRFYRIVGSCNGLVCLRDILIGSKSLNTIILWNPSVQKSIELPLPSFHPYWDFNRRVLLGFGCDFQQQQCNYKVVRLVFDLKLSSFVVVEVYSLSTRSWNVLAQRPQSNYYIVQLSSQVFVNGVVHWLICDSDRNRRKLILGFDMKEESLTEILFPDALALWDNDFCISEYGGCLAAMKYNEYEGWCSLWVMKEYGNVESWRQLYKFGLAEGMDEFLGFRNNGRLFATMSVDEMFFSDPNCRVLVSFDPESRETKDLEIFGNFRSIHVEKFVESLVLLDG